MRRNLFSSFVGVLMLLMFSLFLAPPTSVFAATTDSIVITKYANDRSTILSQATVDYQTLEATLPVQGDGVVHQYLQGPVFEGDIWDPEERANIKDWGANKGTDLKDLCVLVGGMYPGDTVEVKASDGLGKTYDYSNVCMPDPRQGKVVICWWNNGIYVPSWPDGMRLVFFAETMNPDGLYVFGNWDQHECMPQNRWYYYNGEYPTTTGHSVKYINRVNIYSNLPATFNLTISSNGDGATTPLAGSSPFAQGAQVTISAVPASGWQFVNWSGSAVADANAAITTLTMDGDKTVTANFTQVMRTLTLAVNGDGATTPLAGSSPFAQGAQVTISAVPASGWQFVNWSGSAVADANAAITTLTMDGDKTVTANFVASAGFIAIGAPNGGESVLVGSPLEITWDSSGITGDINISLSRDGGGTWTEIFTNTANDASETWVVSGPGASTAKIRVASFSTPTILDSSDENFMISAVNGNLTMAVNGNGVTTPSVGMHSYAEGAVVKVAANADSGWQFVNWSGSAVADANAAITTLTLDGDKTVTANFRKMVQNETASPTGEPAKTAQTTPSWYIVPAIIALVLAVLAVCIVLARRKSRNRSSDKKKSTETLKSRKKKQ